MPVPDAEMERLCRELFGDPLDAARRARIARRAEMCARAGRMMQSRLDPATEPAGHAALLRRAGAPSEPAGGEGA